MAFTPSYVGNNAIGASTIALEEDSSYLTQVSIPEGAILASIDIHGFATEATNIGFTPIVFTDVTGAPGLLMVGDSANSAGTGFGRFDDAARWWSLPVGIYFAAATTVWIGALVVSSSTSFTLSYETTGGADKQVDRGAVWMADASVSTVVDTEHVYSIRGRVLEW